MLYQSIITNRHGARLLYFLKSFFFVPLEQWFLLYDTAESTKVTTVDQVHFIVIRVYYKLHKGVSPPRLVFLERLITTLLLLIVSNPMTPPQKKKKKKEPQLYNHTFTFYQLLHSRVVFIWATWSSLFSKSIKFRLESRRLCLRTCTWQTRPINSIVFFFLLLYRVFSWIT